MSEIVLSTLSVKTDPLAVLQVTGVSYTQADVAWNNPSAYASDFRLYGGVTSGSYAELARATVQPNTASYPTTLVDLAPGTQYSVRLERYESGKWVAQANSANQSDYMSFTTGTAALQLSASTTSVAPRWTVPSMTRSVAASYTLRFTAAGKPVEITSFSASGSSYFCFVTGLTAATPYTFSLYVLEAGSQVDPKLLSTSSVTTTTSGTVGVRSFGASFVNVQWSGVQGDVRVRDKLSGTVLWQGSSSSCFISNLTKDTPYELALELKQLDGITYTEEGSVPLRTASSSLSIVSVASSTATLAWTSAYVGAAYRLSYAVEGAPAGTAPASVSTTDLTATVDSLLPNSKYEFALSVVEDSKAVDLSGVRLGTTGADARNASAASAGSAASGSDVALWASAAAVVVAAAMWRSSS